MQPCAAGIRLHQGTLTAGLLPAKLILAVENGPKGYGRLAAWLRQAGAERILIEAAQGREWPLFNALAAAGFTPWRVSATRRASYALATERLGGAEGEEHTAWLLARFAARMEPEDFEPDVLQEWVEQRDALKQMLMQCEGLRESTLVPDVLAAYNLHIGYLTEQIQVLQQRIDELP
ncbi:hypothetical protein [Pseudomonas sp. NPDC007930]|uniref:hypothetical protein n=1 Tax=Pseudomonas sp. NPDC007930 TaxID=3364417 RepID=UPI0036E4E5DF